MAPPSRLARVSDVGRIIAAGRRRAQLSQEEFATRIGVSRKTLSDLERGVAEHVSLKTVLKALSLAGFVLEASPRRPPTLSEILAERAEYQTRVDRLSEPSRIDDESSASTPIDRSTITRKRRS